MPKSKSKRKKQVSRAKELTAKQLLADHFAPVSFGELTIAERKFPFRVRADLQRAIDRLFATGTTVARFSGVRKEYAHEGLDFPTLLTDADYPAVVVPPQYEDVDVGDEHPVRCLKTGLWLLRRARTRYAVLLAPATKYGEVNGVKFQIATAAGEPGEALTREFFRHLEESVLKAESYRGKILSLEKGESYSGQSTGIRVHKLRPVERDQVILPAATLELLDRNVIGFVRNRPRLAQFHQSTKKGVLFYGPPGTGKTHTIHYLARSLPGHTTLLVSAEQVTLLAEYMTLARLLQPSMVVIEDVDLIARDRQAMNSPCEEVLLNKLLNEMDGLREDADILFVLTTNRPEALEAALASRPGRVDQAIEFPPPDDEGRAKLVRLYSQGVRVPEDVVGELVKRTDGVSAAFIKELMRRSVQFHVEGTDSGEIALTDVEHALDELLFSGGSLNRKLLGGGGDGDGEAYAVRGNGNGSATD
jgi:hypothetical protein